MSVTIRQGDCLDVLRTLPDVSIHCCVTSPPYFGLRDYGQEGQIGLESTPDEYIARLVAVFREVRRVLRDDGTLWLNLGDSYAAGKTGRADDGSNDPTSRLGPKRSGLPNNSGSGPVAQRKIPLGLKPKDLIGIPWRVAFALQADGWYLRQDIIWAKPNPMPESVRDRCTKAHEYVFLLSKSARYWFDADAITEPADISRSGKIETSFSTSDPASSLRHDVGRSVMRTSTRNRRSVWTIATQPFSESHFAVMPPALAELCIKAGCPQDGTVLDPFGGAGTTGLVADRLQRNAVLIELNPDYADMARARVYGDCPLFAEAAS